MEILLSSCCFFRLKNGFAKGFALEDLCLGFGIGDLGQWVKVGKFGGKRLGI